MYSCLVFILDYKESLQKTEKRTTTFLGRKGWWEGGGVIIRDYIINLQLASTGLPTKDDNSKTTVLNLYCLFPYINDFLLNCSKHVFFAKSLNKKSLNKKSLNKKSLNKKFKDHIQGRPLNSTLRLS